MYYAVLGIGGLQQTHTLAAYLAGVIFGPMGYKITSILMFISVVAYVNVNIMSNPRTYYAMAEDGVLPPIFKKVNPKTQVQEFGMSFFVAAILLILFFIAKFGEVLNYVMFFETIGTSIAAAAIFVLRRKTRQMDTSNIYTIKLFPLIPLLFVLSYWFVTINIFITFKSDPLAVLWCIIAYAVGLAIYFLGVRKKEKPGVTHVK
ncbi:APC family permease [Mucilaginibacter terrenus]|uniref:APC family permease n=1 Tax=Mucilaginibacter terrenus TaxID=2482727 RepID=UPI0021D05083|nr:amino acid permease [Mucilaginibacter terrenus]